MAQKPFFLFPLGWRHDDINDGLRHEDRYISAAIVKIEIIYDV